MRAKRDYQQFIHHRQQVLQYSFDLRENLHIVVAHHAQAAAPKPGITTRIPASPFGAEMLTAVHFDDQANRGRPKLRDERSQGRLTAGCL